MGGPWPTRPTLQRPHATEVSNSAKYEGARYTCTGHKAPRTQAPAQNSHDKSLLDKWQKSYCICIGRTNDPSWECLDGCREFRRLKNNGIVSDITCFQTFLGAFVLPGYKDTVGASVRRALVIQLRLTARTRRTGVHTGMGAWRTLCSPSTLPCSQRTCMCTV